MRSDRLSSRDQSRRWLSKCCPDCPWGTFVFDSRGLRVRLGLTKEFPSFRFSISSLIHLANNAIAYTQKMETVITQTNMTVTPANPTRSPISYTPLRSLDPSVGSLSRRRWMSWCTRIWMGAGQYQAPQEELGGGLPTLGFLSTCYGIWARVEPSRIRWILEWVRERKLTKSWLKNSFIDFFHYSLQFGFVYWFYLTAFVAIQKYLNDRHKGAADNHT